MYRTITTQAIHTGTDYDAETGAVRRPLHMANSYKLPDDLSQVNYSSTDLLIHLYPAQFRKGFIRFSVGLEEPGDNIADLNQALRAVGL